MLLLDTHALIWWVYGDERFPVHLRDEVNNMSRPVYVSAVSAMEITAKHRIGKLPRAASLANHFQPTIKRLGFLELPIAVSEGGLAGRMKGEHKDPFDRLLIAQALLNHLTLVSNEKLFDDFGVARIW